MSFQRRRIIIDDSSSEDGEGASDNDSASSFIEENASAMSFQRRRIIIDDSSSEDGEGASDTDSAATSRDTPSLVPHVTNMPTAMPALRPMVCNYDSLSDSSSLDGMLESLRIQSPEPIDDNEDTGFFANAETPTLQSEDEAKEDDDLGSEEFAVEPPWAFNKETEDYYFTTKSDTFTAWPYFRLPSSLFRKLYDYQLAGVQRIAGVHSNNIGMILGDDMGMGKTFTTLALLGGLMKAGTIRNTLVVAPLSVLRSWEKEARGVLILCVPTVQIRVLSSTLEKAQRARMLQDALACSSKRPHLVISTYGLLRETTSEFINERNQNAFWDYVVLDEGHTIKNHKSQWNRSCHDVCYHNETRRLMLSGTPIMNKLEELWSVFDWATSGRVLGTLKDFKSKYVKPIEAARDRVASNNAVALGERVKRELQEKVGPHFLQRLKIDYLKDKLPKKTELVVWTHLSVKQRAMYSTFLEEGNLLTSILNGEKMTGLEAITWLKKLCGHPLLVEGKDPASYVQQHGIEKAVQDSSKLGILVDLVDHLRSQDHKTLVFSQSTKMLDLIQKVLVGVKLSRIDGQTKESDRQRLVDDFNSPNSLSDVMLLSTKAAGVGLTLVGADRVIVYDPSWTPAEDSQAVDRSYRIGQNRDVLVYRMITAGTVEEKMYEKQIYKDGIQRTVFSIGTTVQRYFDQSELSMLLKLAPAGVCETMDKIQHVETDWSQQQDILSHYGVVGLSRHDGFYQATETDGENGSQSAFGVSTPVPKMQGKSGRILQRSNDLEAMPLGRNKTADDSPESSVDSYLTKPVFGSKPMILLEDCMSPTASKAGVVNVKTPAVGPNAFYCTDDEANKADKENALPRSDHSNVGRTPVTVGVTIYSPYFADEEENAQADEEENAHATLDEPFEVGETFEVDDSLLSMPNASISEVLLQAEKATCPKLALQLLTDVQENRWDQLDRQNKMEFHKRIAHLAGSLGLIDEYEEHDDQNEQDT